MMTSLINSFFDSYINNDLSHFVGLDDNPEISFSTVGNISGYSNVIDALALPGKYSHRYNIVSNYLQYKNEDNTVVIINAFHFLVSEASSFSVSSASNKAKGQIFPLIFGGKYKFLIKNNLIKKISFDLEGQFGNTYRLKKTFGYCTYEETKNNPKNVLLDKDREYITYSDKEKIINCITEFMLIADTTQVELINEVVDLNSEYLYSDSAYALAVHGYEKDRTINDFVRDNKKYEDQGHHSFKIDDLKINNKNAKVRLLMFEPTKLGNKHYYSNTLYQPYFNEEWEIELNLKNNNWKIAKASKKVISKFEQPGYVTMNLQDTILWS